MPVNDFTDVQGPGVGGPVTPPSAPLTFSQNLTRGLTTIGGLVKNGVTGISGFPVITSNQSGILSNLPLVDPSLVSLPLGNLSKNLGAIENAGLSALTQIKDAAGNITGVAAKGSSSSVPTADQRLRIVRPRSANGIFTKTGAGAYSTDRGPIATMKLLPGPNYDPKKAVTGKDGAKTPNVSSDVDSLLAGSFANFFLTGVSITYAEKSQVTQTFGDSEVVYYFGRQPLVFSLSGLLFDSIDNDWFSHFLTLYAGVLRGSELAKNFSLVQIYLPNLTITGTISALSTQQSSERDTDIPFTMEFLAKEVTPVAAVMANGFANNNAGASYIDFSADKGGVQSASLVNKTLTSGFADPQAQSQDSGFVKTITNAVGKIQATAASVGSAISEFRTNIFSPIVGVIAGITKVVKTATGTISSIISSFTSPINKILGDVMNISNQARNLIGTVENAISGPGGISPISNLYHNLKATIASLKMTAGVITRMPKDISQAFSHLYGQGLVTAGAAILTSGKTRKKSKAALLSSGRRFTVAQTNTFTP